MNRTYALNYEKMLIVTHDKWFVEKLKKARSYLKIPEGGFKDSEEIKEWYHNEIDLKSDNIITSDEFNKKIHKAKNDSILIKELHREIPVNHLSYFTNDVLDHYRLGKNFEEYLRNYIIFGDLNAPSSNYRLHTELDNEDRKKKHISIEIFGALSTSENKALKNQINHYVEYSRFGNRNLKPLDEIEKAIVIKTKSSNDKKKNDPYFDDKEIYTDRDVAEQLELPKRKLAKKNMPKTLSQIRTKRLRLKQRIEEHFPGISVELM